MAILAFLTKNWKVFLVYLNRFELDVVSDLKPIGQLVLNVLISLRLPQKCSV